MLIFQRATEQFYPSVQTIALDAGFFQKAVTSYVNKTGIIKAFPL